MKFQNLLDDLLVKNHRLTAVAGPAFRKRFLCDDFFVEYDEDILLERIDESILQIPFVLNVVPLVWISGGRYRIGAMDAVLFSALENVRRVYRTMYPRFAWDGELVPDTLAERSSPEAADEIALLFSGGVDSTYSSLVHGQQRQLLISILSSTGMAGWRSEAVRKAAKDRLASRTSPHEARHRFVTTNLCEFISSAKLTGMWPHPRRWLIEVQHGIGFVGLTAPILAWDRLRTLLMAACELDHHGLPSGSSPELLRALRWTGVDVAADGADVRRQQKLQAIHAFYTSEDTRPDPLHSCLGPSDALENCCACNRCCQTVLGLMGAGADPATYGFSSDPLHLLANLARRAPRGRLPIPDLGELLQWLDVQAAIRRRLANPQAPAAWDPATKADLRRFAELDLVRAFVCSHAGPRQAARSVRRRLGLWIDRWPAFGAAVRQVLRR